MVWPRDLVEAAGGLLAVGAVDEVRNVLAFLERTQSLDGHWPQNMWVDGTPYWNGVQLDETAFPILLVDLARRRNVLDAAELKRLWLVVWRAAAYLVRNGPVTDQDRWEEDPGYSPFTLAVTIAALLAAADLADLNGDGSAGVFLRETADFWNDSIERWTYVRKTKEARDAGVDGYYVRIAPPEAACALSAPDDLIAIKNRLPGQGSELAEQIISPDALALVRFGLRAADDPRIVNSVKLIDAFLKTETPHGPGWHRYTDDGYGEHADGTPFDGTGIGRVWPLLTGERAHYELAAGRPAEAARLLRAIETMANDGRFHSRTGLGQSRSAGSRTLLRPPFRLGHAPGLGARRIPQTAPLSGRWPNLRPATAARPPLLGAESGYSALALAVQPTLQPPAAGKDPTGRSPGRGGGPVERRRVARQRTTP